MAKIPLIAFLLLAASIAGSAVQAEGTRTAPAADQAMVVAEASCASLCRQRHNQCRISTKGSPRCDSDLQRCLQGCIATKRR
jgi:hypothetical protein